MPFRRNWEKNPRLANDDAYWAALLSTGVTDLGSGRGTIFGTTGWRAYAQKDDNTTIRAIGVVRALPLEDNTPVSPGETWTCSARIYAADADEGEPGDDGLRITMRWYDAAGGFLSQDQTVPEEIVEGFGGVKRYAATATAPTNAATLRPSWEVVTDVPNDIVDVWFGSFLTEQTNEFRDYFDGDTATFKWDGIPHASTSSTRPISHVREKPPLWLAHDIQAPSGRHYRWGPDEPEAANVPSGETLSTTASGGFEQAGARLPRKPGIDYGDAQRLADWCIYGAGGEVAWEGRLNRAAKSSGDEQSISPEGGGWSNHLEDDKTARMIYRDVDLSRWTGASAARKLLRLDAGFKQFDPSTDSDTETGLPALALTVNGPWDGKVECLGFYDAGPGTNVARLYWDRVSKSDFGATSPSSNFVFFVGVADNDLLSGFAGTGDYHTVAADSETDTFTPSTAKRWAAMIWRYEAGANAASNEYTSQVRDLAVYGDHGLTLRGTEPDAGFYASDVLAHALRTWAPLLKFSEGAKGTIQPTGFIIPHLAFYEPTTAAEIVREALRYHVNPWFVWEDRTFYMHRWGARGRRWRARVGPSKLQQAGDDVERLWNGVMVQFRDVDGSTRTVGPTGTGADTEDANLLDSDSQNPANLLGIRRYAVLDMGTVSRPGAAIEVGRRFLEESKLLDTSGSAQHVGTCIDEHGVEWPAWMIRAGDSIAYIDASEPGYRRVVRTKYEHSTRTCSVDLGAPPNSLDALLARLGVVLVSLGF